MMKISELIARYGDEQVDLQNLDQCTTHIDYQAKRGIAEITFGTDQPIDIVGMTGPCKLGLVLWFDRSRVAELLPQPPASTEG